MHWNRYNSSRMQSSGISYEPSLREAKQLSHHILTELVVRQPRAFRHVPHSVNSTKHCPKRQVFSDPAEYVVKYLTRVPATHPRYCLKPSSCGGAICEAALLNPSLPTPGPGTTLTESSGVTERRRS